MQVNRKPGRLGRRGKIFITLAVIFGTLAVLLYFEQVAIIYIGSALALIVLLIVVAFSDLEKIGINAVEEAYMTKQVEGDGPEEELEPIRHDKETYEPYSPTQRSLERREAK